MEFSVYGSLRAGVYQADTDDEVTSNAFDGANVLNPVAPTHTETADSAKDAWHVGTSKFGNRIGIKGSEDLGNGLSAGFRFERGSDGAAALNRRHENVWIGGGWGKFTIGQQDNPYRAAANWDQSYWLGGANRFGDTDSRINGIRYDSAGLGPVRFSLMATADDAERAADAQGRVAYEIGVNSADAATLHATASADVNAVAVENEEDGIDVLVATIHYDIGDIATVNLGYRTDNQEDNRLGQSYDNAVISANGVAGPLSWYVAYEMSDDNVEKFTVTGNHTGGTTDDAAIATANRGIEPQDAETVGVFLAFDTTEKDRFYLEYEDSSVDGIYTGYGDDGLEAVDSSASHDQTAILLGYSHSIGPGATFIVEYIQVDPDSDLDPDSSTLFAGLKVDF